MRRWLNVAFYASFGILYGFTGFVVVVDLAARSNLSTVTIINTASAFAFFVWVAGVLAYREFRGG